MTSVYIDYPVPHFSIQHGVSATSRMRQIKPERRLITINLENLSLELARFADREIPFAAFAAQNDLWLDIDLGNEEFEIAVIKYIQFHLGKRYKPLATAQWKFM